MVIQQSLRYHLGAHQLGLMSTQKEKNYELWTSRKFSTYREIRDF